MTTFYVTDADNREVLEYDGASGQVLRWYAYEISLHLPRLKTFEVLTGWLIPAQVINQNITVEEELIHWTAAL